MDDENERFVVGPCPEPKDLPLPKWGDGCYAPGDALAVRRLVIDERKPGGLRYCFTGVPRFRRWEEVRSYIRARDPDHKIDIHHPQTEIDLEERPAPGEGMWNLVERFQGPPRLVDPAWDTTVGALVRSRDPTVRAVLAEWEHGTGTFEQALVRLCHTLLLQRNDCQGQVLRLMQTKSGG